MVVFCGLAMIFGKVILVVSTNSHWIEMCKDSCVATKRCDTLQKGIFSYACHRQIQSYNHTPESDTGMKCTVPCKSVSENLNSQHSQHMHRQEDTKKNGVVNQKKQNDHPSRQGYEQLTVGSTTFHVKKYAAKKTWEKALEQCRSDGGTLVKIDTRQKNRLLFRRYVSFKSHWIGLKDVYDNDTFFWTDGSPVTFSKWQKDEPSHRGQVGKIENCVDLSVDILRGQGWNDQGCYKSFQFICEI